MPFVTEELWQRLPRAPIQNSTEASPPSLMVASYPEPVPRRADPKLNEQMKFLSSIVKGVGQLRTDYKLASSKRPQLSITCSDLARAELIAARSLELTTLALASSLEVSHLINMLLVSPSLHLQQAGNLQTFMCCMRVAVRHLTSDPILPQACTNRFAVLVKRLQFMQTIWRAICWLEV